ncbi:MAG: glucose-1-phosphate thymidylyltransferase [Ilumatobacteraceae bacterium]|jgi:glucose-1-phosphate thymidylyltransferase|nr:glucose-1-phosphate thymidylyltransferase [Ilumatobacteraceae bacterium]
MKGLILSGGAGTRLRPITHTSAKQLVPIANKPILFYGIEAMAEAGISEIGIITGDTGAEIRAAVGDGSKFGVKVTYIPQDAPLGLAHCVLIAQDFLGEDDFVMYLGDNMLQQGLSQFVQRFEKARAAGGADTPSAQILLCEVEDPRHFGVAEVNAAGEVVRLVEKPSDPPSNLALVGVYLFDKTVNLAVRSIEPSPRGELEITDAIQWLVDNKYRVTHEVLKGWWIDTGKKDPLLECNRLVLEVLQSKNSGTVDAQSQIEGRVVIEQGAVIENSRIRGPVVIGSDSVVRNSYIGPYTSVGNKCTVSNSEIEHSVLLDGSSISDINRMSDSLVGRNVVVKKSHQRPSALRLMLGDDSTVEVE